MVDVAGKTDTQEMYEHWSEVKGHAASMMQQAHDLGNFGGELKPADKERRVGVFKAEHSDCAICLAFEGNLPKPVEHC
jgi:hypothetical protein